MNIIAIEKTVCKIRAQFETGLVNRYLLINIYNEYTDVGDTVSFVNKAKDIFPRGNCGIASLYLKKELGGEIVRGKYGKHNHTFLLIDNTVIDITADQFGGPEVYVGPLQHPWTLKKVR
ncbi:MAG: hypothetical protein AAB769_00945 [Patescibacteria group bacterium]